MSVLSLSAAQSFLQQHDPSLLALAAMMAFLSAFTTIHLLQRAKAEPQPARGFWLAGVSIAGGGGVWASQFIGVLAYHPGTTLRTTIGLTILSLLIAVLATAVTLTIALRVRKAAMRACAGALLGLGYAMMHYTGMGAVVLPGVLLWNLHLVEASILLAGGFSAGAVVLALGRGSSQGRSTLAALLLGVGVCVLCTAGMMGASVQLRHAATAESGTLLMPPALLALNVAFVGTLVLLLGAAALFVSHYTRRRREAERTNFCELADIAVEGLIVCKGQSIVAANRSFLTMSGLGEETITGVPVARLFEGNAAPRSEFLYPSGEKMLMGAGGERIPVEVASKRIDYAGAPHTVLALRDQRERQKADEAIRFLAHYDSLTGLANRATFAARLALQLRDHARAHNAFAILAIDIDRFKEVNEALGHHTGDLLLARAAHRLRATVRDSDCVARLGGDEFAVLALYPISEETVVTLAERILEVLARPFILEGKIVNVGASIGVAVAPQDGEDEATLMKSAELALYRAKSAGCNNARRYEPGMDVGLQTRRALELDLRRALTHGQFEMQYQPLLDLRTQSVLGFEALLRWRHPTRGLVPPLSFIPLAEDTGLIVPIGEFVLQSSTLEAAKWDGGVSVSVNLSPAQFASGKIVETVSSALDQSGLSPHRLELEITESVLLQESGATLKTLHQLRDLGVRVAMDDFGTGYSSLRYLKDFPFDRIKIDRSFIAAMLENQESAAIISAVVALSRRLGILTTAEGVETEAQMARIREEGCDTVQGYLIGRPTPAAELHRFFPDPASVLA